MSPEEPRKLGLGTAWWRWCLGLALLGTLFFVVGPRELWETARRASPVWGLGVLVSAAIWLLLGGLNVWILLRRLADVPLALFLRVYVTSWAAALVLPGQLGDATQIVLLREHGVTTDQSGAAYVVDKVVSLTWMLCVAAVGMVLYVSAFEGMIWLVFAPFGLILLLLLGWRTLPLLTPRRSDGLVAAFTRWLYRLVEQLRAFLSFPGTLALNVTLTILKWILMACIYLTAFRAFGAEIPFAQASTLPVMSSLVGYIPITVGGAGTMEWTAVVLFDTLGVDGATVVSAFVFQRLVLLVVGLLLVVVSGHRTLRKREVGI